MRDNMARAVLLVNAADRRILAMVAGIPAIYRGVGPVKLAIREADKARQDLRAAIELMGVEHGKTD